ncbi:TIR domain-containing protein [Parafrankia discariae]|uniref:TIR domain-containing protein n=1 Tax=Parafrankia discariae TaxID=365528 RepID=UPI0003768067|nr:TIR domain-containing protein [Parafrankia discariae]
MAPRAMVEPVAFLSYAHKDDTGRGRLTRLRADLEHELCERSGRDIKIFQDRSDIVAGDVWRPTLETGLGKVLFLLPVVSPAFAASDECLREFTQFLALERAEQSRHGVRRRIIPIYWSEMDLAGLLAAAEESGDDRRAAMLRVLRDRQHHGSRPLSALRPSSGTYVREVGRLAQVMADRLPPPPTLGRRVAASVSLLTHRRGRVRTTLVATTTVLAVLVAFGLWNILGAGDGGGTAAGPDTGGPCGTAALEAMRSRQTAAIPGKLQCVGVRTDAAGAFAVADPNSGVGAPAGTGPLAGGPVGAAVPSAVERSVEAAWREVVAENERADREHGTPTGRLTVVLAGHLSSGEETDGLDNVELLTALTAMRRFNATHPDGPRMRVWAANLGGDAEFAAQAGDRIREATRNAGPVIVVGLGQTRDDSEKMINDIGQTELAGNTSAFSGVPMIAATQSGTDLTGEPGYFRIGGSDDRQAEMGLSWAPRGQLDQVVPFIVYDEADRWGRSMLDAYTGKLTSPEYESRFSGTAFETLLDQRVITYSTDPDTPRPLGQALADPQARICGDNPEIAGVEVTDAPRLIIYAGRTAELPELLTLLMTLPAKCRSNIHVLGGDALSDLRDGDAWETVQEILEKDPATRPKLLFSAFGPEDPSSARTLFDNGLIADFGPAVSEFRRVRDQLPEEDRPRFAEFPDSAAWALYDAVTLAGQVGLRAESCRREPALAGCRELLERADAVRETARRRPVLGFDGFDLYVALREVYQGRSGFVGVTGPLHAGVPDRALDVPDQGGGLDPTGKLMAVYELSAEPSRAVTTLRCAIPDPRVPAAASTRCDDGRLRPQAP